MHRKNTRLSDFARFLCKVEATGPWECWFWTGALTPAGYGSFRINGVSVLAHRFMYELVVGEIPDSKEVCHWCDRPNCVNPIHFFIGTHADNMADMAEKGRSARGDRHGSITYPKSVPRGESHYKTRLKDRDVIKMRRMAEQGVAQRIIAELFGVDSRTVSKIVHRIRWKHVK